MPRAKPEGEGDFHVVRKRHFVQKGSALRGMRTEFFVYCNNVPFLKGHSTPLSRREAQWIAGILNERCKRARPYSKDKKVAA